MAEAKIEPTEEGDELVIRVPVHALPQAVEGAWACHALPRRYQVTDPEAFAKDFVRALNCEDENGTTDVHRMLDAALNRAIRDGAEGIEDHPNQEF